MELLDYQFPDINVRNWAVGCLDHMKLVMFIVTFAADHAPATGPKLFNHPNFIGIG